ncbi:hypothetical protein RFI_11490 [Reticulomyxa filosa]|uniref:MIF4G domain-containing protein n=1 Tax=Reticulomyxa filosa TaxID=46433 RepID=X6NIT1_RETFI|nr:hypothetical protein RFI_11490 [Reticulomyxa filosa]|eukprot:ETO25649.1 hypothetical protein RFI_11490 [Reticulomyxa filosa]
MTKRVFQEFTRSIRSILNKITLDNFDTLSGKVVTLYEQEVHKPTQLEKLVELIFEKTVIEPEYGPLYARLCVGLSKHNRTFILITPEGQKETGFRGILLKQCETEFIRSSDQLANHVKKNSSSLTNLSEDEREYEITQQKKALMGTIKFIGQLYLQELLPYTLSIMTFVENAIAHFTLIRSAILLITQAKTQMKGYYSKLTQLRNDDRNYPPRIRILVRNLLDWRQTGWQKSLSGRPDLKTTEQVRQEFNEQRGQNRQLPKISETESDMVLRMIETGALIDPGFAKKADIESLTGSLPSYIFKKISRNMNITKLYRYETSGPAQKQSGLTSERGNVGQRERQQNRMRLLLPTDNLIQNESEAIDEIDAFDESKKENVVEYKPRQRADGPELKKDLFMEWLREYFDQKLPKQQLVRHLEGYQWNPKKIIEWSFRSAVDKSEVEQELTTLLWIAMLKDGLFTSKNLEDTMSEFFETYTTELNDAPKLAEYLSRMLAPLFISKELDLKLVEEWLQKDPSMTKPYRKNSKLSKQLEFIGQLFEAIRECGDTEVTVQELVRTSKFDLDKFLKEELRNDFANQFVSFYFL